ncbi:MAG TPA: acyltransferase [Rhizomicrobium sp.]|nr:acyltransferase [Rhizomicrobium sp.]
MSRNTYVDVLRAFAIMSVLFEHWMGSGITPNGLALYRSFPGFGSGGVYLFFVISGYVITTAAIGREADLFALSYRTFYPRRVARILPLLILSCLIGVFLLAFPGAKTELYEATIRNPKAIFDWAFWASIATFTFNIWRIENLPIAPGWGLHWDVLWSLAVEEQFYIAFPLLLLVAKNRKRLVLILLSIIALSITYRLAYRWHHSGFNSLVCFEFIAAGVMTALYAQRTPRHRIPLFATLGAILLAIGFTEPFGEFINLFKNEFIAGGAVLLLACAAVAPRNRPAILVPFALIGELSYGMYLLHSVILYEAGPMLGTFGTLTGYMLFVLGTSLVAAVSYRSFEKPAEQFTRQRLIRLLRPKEDIA